VVERASRLTLYARQWLDGSAAEDAVQEALTSLLMLKHLPADPMAWMFRTVRNAAIDQARASARRRKREQAFAAVRVELFQLTPDALIDAQLAEHALKELPADQREVVVLRIWGEMGFTQIAEIVRHSVSTVHAKYTAALETMRQRLEESCKTNKMK
jgi:RNA polymerase sigma-70 factor (ECF subfamily)